MGLLARRSTIAPVCFIENRNHLIIGDKYVKIMSFFGYPFEFIEGLLAPHITNSDYYLDIVTERSDLDFASVLKTERNEYNNTLKKSHDPTEQAELREKIKSLDFFIEESVRRNSATLNVICQLYIKADTLEQLQEKERVIKNNIGSSATGISLRNIALIQQGLFKKNSPLFIKSGLRKETDYNNGRLMSSLTTAGLWPWIFDTLDDGNGTLIGRELTTGGKIVFDQFFYRSNPEMARFMNRPNGNMVVIGRTGAGKTTFMNLLVHGHILNHRKIIWIDPENKNETLCKFVGGNYIAIGLDNNIINIFDLKPISSDSDSHDSIKEMYSNKNAIFNVVEDIKITFKLLFPDLSSHALAMIKAIVVETYESVGISLEGTFETLSIEAFPTFTNFRAVLKEKLELYRYSPDPKSYKLEIKALSELEIELRHIVDQYGEGEYGRFFNGTTTIKSDSLENTGMIAIGTKYLFSAGEGLKNALLRMIFQYAWSLCLGKEKEQTVFINDEQHMFIQEPELAKILAIFQRRARKYNTVTLSGTQEVVEYTNPDIITHGKAIFNNAIYGLYMNLTKDGVEELSKLIHLTPGEKDMLQELDQRQGILIAGKKHLPIEVLATADELSLME